MVGVLGCLGLGLLGVGLPTHGKKHTVVSLTHLVVSHTDRTDSAHQSLSQTAQPAARQGVFHGDTSYVQRRLPAAAVCSLSEKKKSTTRKLTLPELHFSEYPRKRV